ncbi:hypothetical protein PBT90_04725 [Algoriphagus halophytocola]|uniref:Septum formation inhibitor Maf n=1 Tax=Algoriphagus halophytocola TaxID=2991499 RepID=A0ABY6MHP5_9BACT|nr:MULTISPECIES: hypothetical protein [unclassified Algoriphagus]UZD22723.1 hypothetical protein OM944_18985 [Algoriphagus sp. TR-M5]WBL43988.1 hypothetical protein PBT90_04725 [Algoriphagus sp. TR-M9]
MILFRKYIAFTCLLISIVLWASCNPTGRKAINEEQFASRWYQGKAEINVFDLKQMRYGEEREGNAVMIFVTEDFSKRKQVKLDDPTGAGKGAMKVMKLNMTRDFVTGVYPYNTMLSVFTPVYDDLNSPKIVASVTEWCGQSFVQMNWKNNKYQAKLFSYFEAEGDQEVTISALAEDELFNLIRLNPDLVPDGYMKLIPSLIYNRFTHYPLGAESAKITKRKTGSNQAEVEVIYQEIGRKLLIRYMDAFPYEIMSWEESLTKEDGTEELTSAVRTNVQMLDYWNRNGLQDESIRKSLGL